MGSIQRQRTTSHEYSITSDFPRLFHACLGYTNQSRDVVFKSLLDQTRDKPPSFLNQSSALVFSVKLTAEIDNGAVAPVLGYNNRVTNDDSFHDKCD